jgi:hypothetical protein
MPATRRNLVIAIEPINPFPTSHLIQRVESALGAHLSNVCPHIHEAINAQSPSTLERMRSVKRAALLLSVTHPEAYLCLHVKVLGFHHPYPHHISPNYLIMCAAQRGVPVCFRLDLATGDPLPQNYTEQLRAYASILNREFPQELELASVVVEEAWSCCNLIRETFQQTFLSIISGTGTKQ